MPISGGSSDQGEQFAATRLRTEAASLRRDTDRMLARVRRELRLMREAIRRV